VDDIVTFEDKPGPRASKESRHKGAQNGADVLPRSRKPGGDLEAEVERLAAALADAKAQARAAGEALARSAEELAALRRAKESAEAVAHKEFQLRLHMEGDRMLSDSAEKALHATIQSLREQIGSLTAGHDAVEALRVDLARGLERERVAQFQIAALHESLEAARATIANLTAENLTAHSEASQEPAPTKRKGLGILRRITS
jgi:hypothetical protein